MAGSSSGAPGQGPARSSRAPWASVADTLGELLAAQHAARKLLLSLLLGALVLWVLGRGGLPLVPPRASFAALHPLCVPGYALCMLGVNFLRTARWRHLLRPLAPVSLRTVMTVGWLGLGAILFAPLRSGELVRPLLITRRSRVPLWEATGTVGAERVVDGLVLSAVLALGLASATPLAPLPEHVGALPVPVSAVPHAAYVALALFGGAFAAMGAFYVARDAARRAVLAVVGLLSRRLAARVAEVIGRVADGLRFLPSRAHVAPFLLETAAYWALNVGGIWLLGLGVGLGSMTLSMAAVTVGCVGLGVLTPAAPGFFGTFQLSAYMALAMFFPEAVVLGPGAAFVFLLYTTQVVVIGATTLAGLALDGGRQASPRGADDAASLAP